MIICNLPSIPGKNVEILDVVSCSSVFSKHVGKDIMSGFKNLVGGEVKSYTSMVEDARKQAFNKLKKNGEDLGADAVLNVTYTTTNMMSGSAIALIITGTAVRFI